MIFQDIGQGSSNIFSWIIAQLAFINGNLASARLVGHHLWLQNRVIQISVMNQVIVGEKLGNIVVGQPVETFNGSPGSSENNALSITKRLIPSFSAACISLTAPKASTWSKSLAPEPAVK